MSTQDFKKVVVRRPAYMNEFRCIGGDCEENCCAHRWLIYIDKNTYKKYRKIRNVKLKPLLDQYIVRNKKDITDQSYARIEFGEKPQCVFLTEEKLCGIQLELGEDNLSMVCRLYPRIRNVIDGVWEECVDTSCPQAARDILLCQDGISFEERQIEVKEKSMLTKVIANLHGKTSPDNVKHYLWELRTFTIQVLKTRDYTLWERLIIIGLFYQQLSQFVELHRVDKTQSLIDTFTEMIVDGSFKQQLVEIPAQAAVQVDVLKMIADERLLQGVQSQAYLECYRDFLHGIGFSDKKELSLEEVTRNYNHAYEDVYSPFMKEREYIFENYLVNYVFKEVFPLKTADVWEAYVLMIIQYALIKLQLVGIAGYQQKNFNEASIVKLVFSFGKVIEHSDAFLKLMMEQIKEKQYDTMPYMAILIKN